MLKERMKTTIKNTVKGYNAKSFRTPLATK
jgi:hypothetical protein